MALAARHLNRPKQVWVAASGWLFRCFAWRKAARRAVKVLACRDLRLILRQGVIQALASRRVGGLARFAVRLGLIESCSAGFRMRTCPAGRSAVLRRGSIAARCILR